MYVRDIKTDFFDVISTERVLVLVNTDVDAVCATKIIQYLFKCDHVLYTLVPVTGKRDFYSAFKNNIEGIKYCLLVNCGGSIDLCDFLDPADEVIFFILDNHRPVDVTNIHNSTQVRLLMKMDPEENVPEYDQIFRDDSDSEDEEHDTEASLLRRREKRHWEEERERLLFSYNRDSFTGSSSALLVYELAWRLSRDTNDLLWWAIVGHTELWINKKMDEDRFVVDTANLGNHVARLNQRGEGETVAVDTMKLAAETELDLVLYRHWSILEALRHTPYTAAKFKAFTLKGEHKISEFLADIGLPLNQCNQLFHSMDFQFKQNLLKTFTAKSDKYSLSGLTYTSFNCNFGFRHKYCAADVVKCLQAVLEHHDNVEDRNLPFLQSLDILARSQCEKLEQSTKIAKAQIEMTVKQVQTILDTKQVISAGPFLYSIIQEGTPNSGYWCRPASLTSLAQFLLTAHVSCSQSRKVTTLPLVLISPLDIATGLSVVVGVAPVEDKNRKNFLGKAFEQAAINTKSRYLLDYWDPNIIKIKTEDRTKFLDGLIAIMSR